MLNWFFERTNKIDNPLATTTKRENMAIPKLQGGYNNYTETL